MGAKRSFFWEDLPPEKLWYLVGLITSDGSLSKDGRHIDITSKEKSYLEVLKSEFNISVTLGEKTNGDGAPSHRLQIGSKSFYDFLVTLGLTANKSKTIGALQVPDSWFNHFLRGVIDGDGCIRKWKASESSKEQWNVKVTSGSEPFLIWLRDSISRLFDISGHVYFETYKASSGYILKISSRRDVMKVLTACYMNNGVALQRKRLKAHQFLKGCSARVAKLVYALDSGMGRPCGNAGVVLGEFGEA